MPISSRGRIVTRTSMAAPATALTSRRDSSACTSGRSRTGTESPIAPGLDCRADRRQGSEQTVRVTVARGQPRQLRLDHGFARRHPLDPAPDQPLARRPRLGEVGERFLAFLTQTTSSPRLVLALSSRLSSSISSSSSKTSSIPSSRPTVRTASWSSATATAVSGHIGTPMGRSTTPPHSSQRSGSGSMSGAPQRGSRRAKSAAPPRGRPPRPHPASGARPCPATRDRSIVEVGLPAVPQAPVPGQQALRRAAMVRRAIASSRYGRCHGSHCLVRGEQGGHRLGAGVMGQRGRRGRR